MNDSTNDDRLERRLRSGLHQSAADLVVEAPASITTIAGNAQAVRSQRRTRRLAVTSLATVAAVGAGLVLISRDPGQPVRTDRNGAAAAAGGFARGAATGSSSGSATGMPRGWTSKWADTTGFDERAPLFDVVPGPDYELIQHYTTSWDRGPGQAPADLAVMADLTAGAPLRFVVASVQDADRLTSGRGGTRITIAGRPARILSHRAATLLTWDVSDTKRALVYVSGVDDAATEQILASLGRDAEGRWAFSARPGGGLEPVATTTPTGQYGRGQSWQQTDAAAGGPCRKGGFAFIATSGGAYEFWAQIADSSRFEPGAMNVTTVRMPGGQSVPAVSSPSGDQVLALAGDAVLMLNQWTAEGKEPASLVDSFASLVVAPTADAWASDVVVPDQVRAECLPPEDPSASAPGSPDTSAADMVPESDGMGPDPGSAEAGRATTSIGSGDPQAGPDPGSAEAKRAAAASAAQATTTVVGRG